MRKGDLRVFLTFTILLKLANCGSLQNKLKGTLDRLTRPLNLSSATRNYHLEERRLLLKSKPGNKLAVHRTVGRDAATNNFSKKILPGEDKIGLRSTVSKAEDEGFIERLTDDIHGLVQLLESRKGDLGEDTSDKRDSSAKGNGLSFDLGFIVDGSKVIDEQGSGNFRKCLEFVKEILRSFQVTLDGVHAGLITYGQTSRLNFNFDTVLDQAGIESTIDSVSYPGTESHTGNALEMAMAKLFPHSGRQNVPHILVVITGSSSQDEVESSAEEIRAGGVKTFCIGVGGRYDQSQLETIASSPSDTYVITTEFDALRNVAPLLSSRIANVLGESTGKPTQAPPDNILSQGGIVEAKIDLGFLIDGSGTVGEKNYRMSLEFMKTIYSTFWTRFGSIHVGLVVYGATSRLMFDFDNKYMDIAEINNAIDSVIYPGGKTAAAGEALKTVKAQLYGSKHHDSYRRILVVIIGSTSADDVFLGAELLKANKVRVLCVGVGNQYERHQMDGIASEPTADNVLTVASYPGLPSLAQTLVDKIEEARTTYIPPQDTSKPRFQRNVSQPGQSLGQTGQGPSAGLTPGIISPQSGQLRPTAATLPSASATTTTITSQPGVNGEKPVYAATTNRPTSKKPLKPEGPIVFPSQGLPSVPIEDSKLDLLFLLDGSHNLQKPGFQTSIEFMKKVYSNFPIGEDAAHVGMVIYENKPRVVFSLNEGENKQSAEKKMLSAIYPNSDGSYLGEGLRAAKESVFDVSARPGGHQVLLVFSGGKSTDETKTSSRVLRDSGVIIFAIGIGNMVDVNKLRDIVTAPEEDHLLISKVEDLDRLLIPTVQNIRAVITEPVAESGPADVKMDLGFLLDVNSAHFSPDLFGNVLNSVKSTYARFVIGKGKTHIGIVTFGGRPRVAVSLEQYTSRQSLDTAVGQIFVSAGPSFLGQGLEVVKGQLFRGKTRPSTPKILVVVTGGKSVDDVAGSSTELKNLNTTIFCVGVGHNMNKEELDVVATSPYHVAVATISYRETVGDNIGARIKKGIQVDLCFMVDGSKNVLESEFKRYLDIVKYIYSAFPVSQEDVHVALGVISTNHEIIFSFDKYFDKRSLDMAVNSVEYPRTPQDLNTGQSLVVAKETLYSKSTRKGTRQVLVLVVSGRSHDDFFDPVRRLRDGGVEIFCFGVGSKVDVFELAEIATTPADKHVVVDALDNLLNGARKLIDKLQIAKVEYDDKQIPNLPLTSQGKGVAIDLVILVEGSEKTKPEEFQQIKEMVKAIYYSFPVSQQGTHVALVVFARETQIIFSLYKHYDHKSMDEDLEVMSYLSGPSRAGNALRDVKTKIIDLDSRPNGPLVLITIMTGKSSDELEEIADELKMACVLMFALGLTSSYSPQSLNQVSGEPHSEYVLISETFPEAHLVAQKMADKIKKVVSVAKSLSQRSVQPGDLELDIAFVVSNCRNAPTDSFIQQMDLVSSLNHSFPETLRKTRMAIISVSDGAKVVQDLTTSSTNLSTIKSAYLQPKGLCTFGMGLEALKSLFKAKGIRGVPQVVVVLFTGILDDDVSKPSKELKEAGILMYTIGLSKTVNESSASALGSEPVSEYFISNPGFPNSDSTKQVLINKLESVKQIWGKLVCIPATGGCKNSSIVNKPSLGSGPCQFQPQNTTRPSANPGSVDRKPSPNNSKTRMGSVDLVFLVEGSDAVNESLFRTLLDIVKDTLSRFPVSLNNTHVAVAIYSMQTQTVVNLKDPYDSNKIKDILDSISKPNGGSTAGKALQAVKNDIFVNNGRSGASRVLLHLMCSQSLDDVIQPAKELREIGVKVVAVGACPQANKAELCNIGSPPLCKNSVFMQTLKPPSSPGKELADRLRPGIPEQNIIQPSTGPEENSTKQPSGLMQPSMPSPWSGLSPGPIFPLMPSLIPVHPPQPLSPAPNIWNYEIPIQKNPVAPDPYTIQDTSFLYSTACADYDPACSAYGVNGYCDGPAIGFSSDYLLKMCKKSCGFCKTDNDFISSGTWIKKARIPNRRLPRKVPRHTNNQLLQASINMTPENT